MNIRNCIMTCLLSATIACSGNKFDEDPVTPYYINNYIKPGHFYISASSTNTIAQTTIDNTVFVAYSWGQMISPSKLEQIGQHDPNAEFRPIALRNKDISFNQSVRLSSPYTCCAGQQIQFDVYVNNKNYNNNHPKGSLLNDIFVIEYLAMQHFLESGYTSEIKMNILSLNDFNAQNRYALPIFNNHSYTNVLNFYLRESPSIRDTFEFIFVFKADGLAIEGLATCILE